jgi:uncharacterized membrane protein
MRVFFLTLFLAVFTSCTKDKTVPAEPLECDDVISFEQHVQPIIMNSCATTGCHSASSSANNMVFESYESVFEYRDEILKAVRHESGVTPMPIGADQLSEIEIQNIACWIAQGASNN